MNITIRTRLTILYSVVLATSFSVLVWIRTLGFAGAIEVTVNDASSIESSEPAGDGVDEAEVGVDMIRLNTLRLDERLHQVIHELRSVRAVDDAMVT